MKRFFLLGTLLIPAMLYGMAYDDIVDNAFSTSFQAESARLRYESGLMSIEQAALDDGTDYSVSFALSPLDSDSQIISVSDLSFSAVLPDDYTTISASIPFAARYDGSGSLISPSLAAEHIFDWGHDDETLKDLQNMSSQLSVDREYESELLSLKMSVIDSIRSLLDNQRSLRESEENLEDLNKELSDSLSLGMITEGSISYSERLLEIKRAEDSIQILKTEKTELERRFHNLTGLEWSGADSIPYPDFPDILSVETSSLLKESEVEAEIAKEEYLIEESRQNPRKLTIRGGAGSSIYLGSGLETAVNEENTISISAGAGWDGKAWSFSVSGGGEWDEDYSFTPALTLSGSWRNNPSSRSEELVLGSLRNEAILRYGEYSDERRSFQEESGELWSRMLSWRRSFSELESEIEYRDALLSSIEVRLERGLATEEEYEDAALDLELLYIDRDILLLEGLSLEAEIRMHII